MIVAKFVGIVLALVIVLVAVPAGATTSKTALIYGDSLVWESRWKTLQTIDASTAWTDVDRSVVSDSAVRLVGGTSWRSRVVQADDGHARDCG